VLVPILGLIKVGGLAPLVHEHPEKFQVFLPATHEQFPFTGVFTGFLTVGLWYSCTSQHIVQRVLAAKDEYNARMGVVGAGVMHIITPLFFTVPGIIAFALHPKLQRADSAYLELVHELIPTGLRGLILAAMAAALMSNLSSVLNSASTLVTIDFYKKFIRRDATEKQQVHFGQLSGAVILLLGVGIALYYATQTDPLFVQVQRVFFFIAPPFAVVFTLGLLWRRANATAALTTIALGFPFSAFLTLYAFPKLAFLQPYNTYQHPAFVAWMFCMAVMIVTSLLTAPPPAEKTEGIIWSARYAALPADLQRRYSGWKDWRLWWLLFVGTVLAIYGFFLWFRFQHPVNMWTG
jgi:SSS family solute:Na+ symporter